MQVLKVNCNNRKQKGCGSIFEKECGQPFALTDIVREHWAASSYIRCIRLHSNNLK